MKNIIILVGASGVGKTTIEKKLLEKYSELSPVKIFVNRKIRDDDPHYIQPLTKYDPKKDGEVVYQLNIKDQDKEKIYMYTLPKDKDIYIVSFIDGRNAIKFMANLLNTCGVTTPTEKYRFMLYDIIGEQLISREDSELRHSSYNPLFNIIVNSEVVVRDMAVEEISKIVETIVKIKGVEQ
jgi:ABC-type oligopeptide transport system ATPase subunit